MEVSYILPSNTSNLDSSDLLDVTLPLGLVAQNLFNAVTNLSTTTTTSSIANMSGIVIHSKILAPPDALYTDAIPPDELLSAGGPLLAEDGEQAGIDPQIEYMGHIAYRVVAPIIISFGVLSNILNLVVLSRPTLRGPTFRYLKWLAVANLLVCIILLPFTLHSYATPVTYLAAFYLAHIEVPLGNALIASGVYIVVGLSIDRYVAVCYPRKYRALYSHYVATVRIASCFVVAFIMYIPMTFYKRVEEGPEGLYLPRDNREFRSTGLFIVYSYLLEICVRVAPGLILAVLNTWIIVEFKKISARHKLLSKGFEVNEISAYPSISANEITQPNLPEPRDSYKLQSFSPSPHTEVMTVEDQKHNDGSYSSPSKRDGEQNHTETCFNNDLPGLDHTVCDNDDAEYEIQPLTNNSNHNHDPILDSNGRTSLSECLYNSERRKDYVNSSEQTPNNKEGSNCSPDPKYDNPASHNHQRKVPLQLLTEKNARHDDNLQMCSTVTNKQSERYNNGGASSFSSKGGSANRQISAMRKGERRHDRERRLVLLLVSIIVAFLVTNIPSAILSITFSDHYRNNLPFQIFRAVANNLEFLNFGLSFVLYFLFSRDIRNVFMCLLKMALLRVGRCLGGRRHSNSGCKVSNNI